MNLSGIKYIVVGAGLCGAVLAERIASDLDQQVVVFDKRDHWGGNCYSEFDPETGIEVHKYGTHIFHTGDQTVADYFGRFTSLNHYRHRVYSRYKDQVYPMPINLETLNRFYGTDFAPDTMRRFLAGEIARERYHEPANLEEQAISLAGRPLYEAFIRGYTQKQWRTDPKQLPAGIIKRLPFRYNYNGDYFNDPVQGLPLEGYNTLFARMLEHRNIDLMLGVDFFTVRDQIPADCKVIYTGPIDRYFDERFGTLGWRSLRFEMETIATEDYQGNSVINYADIDTPFTRIHEFKHLHPERSYQAARSVIAREYSCDMTPGVDEPYYPIGTPRDLEILDQYRQLAENEKNTIFCGRLGSYRYFDMDQVIAEALGIYQRQILKETPNG